MCFKRLSPFARMIFGALIGIILGIIFGLLFGLLIAWVAGTITALVVSPMKYPPFRNAIPYEVSAFFGMGAGAIIGAILGALYANKK